MPSEQFEDQWVSQSYKYKYNNETQ
jgi:hypothetical protein